MVPSSARFSRVTCAFFLMILACPALLFSISAARAGTLTNKDNEVYEYAVYWDDMSEPVTGTIEPRQTVEFANSRGTIELLGKHDSIYVLPDEEVIILRSVMRKP